MGKLCFYDQTRLLWSLWKSLLILSMEGFLYWERLWQWTWRLQEAQLYHHHSHHITSFYVVIYPADNGPHSTQIPLWFSWGCYHLTVLHLNMYHLSHSVHVSDWAQDSRTCQCSIGNIWISLNGQEEEEKKRRAARWVWIIEQSAGVERRDKWKSQKLSVMLRQGPDPYLMERKKEKTLKREWRMALWGRDRRQQTKGLGDRQGERYGWQAAITETEAPCKHSQVCVCLCVTVCKEKRSTAQVEGEWGAAKGGLRSLPAWAPADSHTGRSQAHHVSSVCGNPPSSNDKFVTRLPLSDQEREAQEMSKENSVCMCVYVHTCMCVSTSLSVSASIEGPITCSSESNSAISGLSFSYQPSSSSSSFSASYSETSVSEYAMSVSKRIHPRPAQS